MLTYFLPYNAKQWFYNNTQIFFVIFLLIWVTGFAGEIITPAIYGILSGMDWVVVKILGLFM